MERVCVFCGGRLINKTTEHVLPRWLIKLTGDPKRTATFGFEHSEDGEAKRREFSFDAFKFPACKSCNHKFAELEANAKVIVEKMLCEDAISDSEFNTLLDWFDKLRIGLWLGYRYLDGNLMNIDPHYHIRKRIRMHDRVLYISQTDSEAKGLSFVGCDTPLFAMAPCCFSIRINQYCFINLSYPNLISRRIGFPYPTEAYMMEDETLYCRFAAGRARIMRPILKKHFGIQCKELYQPIYTGNKFNEAAMKLYDTEYVRENCMDWRNGVGKIFMSEESKINIYPSHLSKEWIPTKSHRLESLLFELQPLTLEWQLYIEKLSPSTKLLPKEKRKLVVEKNNFGKSYNRRVIGILREMGRSLGIHPTILGEIK